MPNPRLVAVIPAGNTIEDTLAAMNGMQTVHAVALQVTSDPDTGDLLVLRPAPGQDTEQNQTEVARTAKKAAKKTTKAALAAEDTTTEMTVEMGTGEPGSETALAVAFRSDFTGIPVIAQWASTLLDEHQAQNFLTFTFANPDGDRYALTVQRVDGMSPAEKIADLETQIATLTR